MSDLIKREDAIKAIEELPNAYNGWSDTYDKAYIIGTLEEVPSADIPKKVIAQITFDEEKLREIVKEAVERFKEEYEIADRPQREWIPCSERLPSEDGGEYLVTDYCPQINRRRMRIAYCYANKLGFWSDTPKGYEVIAWMPLPKPYRKDGEA